MEEHGERSIAPSKQTVQKKEKIRDQHYCVNRGGPVKRRRPFLCETQGLRKWRPGEQLQQEEAQTAQSSLEIEKKVARGHSPQGSDEPLQRAKTEQPHWQEKIRNAQVGGV